MKIELNLNPVEKKNLEHAIWLEQNEYSKMIKPNSNENMRDKEEAIKMVKMLDKVMNQLLNQPA